MKKITSLLLVFTMLLGVTAFCTAPAAAAEYSDVEGHWARATIEKWSDYGILKGSGGQFRPNDPVTRGELSAILNRVYKYPVQTEAGFADITPETWCYADMAAMAQQKILLNEGVYAGHTEQLTRQEAVYMLAQTLRFGLSYSHRARGFTDYEEIDTRTVAAIGTMREFGYIQGLPDGSFGALKPVTRAEIVTILDNIFKRLICEEGDYGDVSDEVIAINVPNVTIRPTNDVKKIFILPGASAGTVKIDGSNATIQKVNTGGAIVTVFLFYGNNIVAIGSNPNVCEITNISPEAKLDRPPVQFRKIELSDNRFAGGFGTKDTPYRISNQEQLKLLNEYLDIAYTDVYFKLTNDIVLEGNWMPIGPTGRFGETKNEFFGHLDGGGYTIKNLNVDITAQESTRAGLFTTVSGSIKNLCVEGNVSIRGVNDAGEYMYSISAGGIAGKMSCSPNGNHICSTIENCVSKVNVTVDGGKKSNGGGIVAIVGNHSLKGHRHTIKDCRSEGTVSVISKTDKGDDVDINAAGGIAGFVEVTDISNCVSLSNVTGAGGSFSVTGGLVGMLRDSRMTYSYAAGNIAVPAGSYLQNDVGGALGHTESAVVESCFAVGTVTVAGAPLYGSGAGGFVGRTYLKSEIKNCYALGNVSTKDWAMLGCFVGRAADASVISNCYGAGAPGDFTGGIRDETVKIQGCETFQTGYAPVAWDFETKWIAPSGDTARLPILRGLDAAVQIAYLMGA